MVLPLVLVTVMVNVVCVLVPPTLSIKKLIFELMAVILCHQRVGSIKPRVIHTKTGTIIHNILGWRIILVLLVMVEVVFVIGPPNSPQIKFHQI